MKINLLKIGNLGIKTLSMLAALCAVLILGYSAFAATDTTDITAQFTIDASCSWSGTPFQSALTVADDAVCILTGTHNTGTGELSTGITVATDGNANGVGGTLIVGSSTVNTDIEVNGLIDIQGTVIIGRSGNPSTNAVLKTTGLWANAIIITTNSGSLTTTLNSNGDNYIYANSYMSVGTVANPTGSLTINDNYTPAGTNVLYNNYIYSPGGFTVNAGTFKTGQTTAVYTDGLLTNNSAYSTLYLYLGAHNADIDGGIIQNYGTFSITHNAYTDGMPGGQIYAGTFNNNSGAILNVTHTLRITSDTVPVTVDGYLMNKGTVNALNIRVGKGEANVTCTFNGTTDRVNSASHGLANGLPLLFTTTGTLPTGLNTGTTYYVINSTTNDFQVSLTLGGGAVDFTGSGSGTHYYKVTLNGGLIDNLENGVINVTGTTGTALYVYYGIINNQNRNNSTSMNIDASVEIRGATAANRGKIINTGVVDHASNMNINIYGYGELDLYNGTDYDIGGGVIVNSSRWVTANNGYLYLYGNYATVSHNGSVNIGDGVTAGDKATLSIYYFVMGNSTNIGYVQNYGKIRRVDLNGNVLATSSVYFNIQNTSQLINRSTGIITRYGGSLELGTTSQSTVSYILNESGGQITGNSASVMTLYSNGTNRSYVDNYGLFSGGYLYIGNPGSSRGGDFNNYANNISGDPDDLLSISNTLYASYGGRFYNKSKAKATIYNLIIGDTTGVDGLYEQEEGTSAEAANTKTTVTNNITVARYGILNNYDKMTAVQLTTDSGMISATYGYVGKKGANSDIDSSLSLTSTATINGYATVCDVTCSKEDSVLSSANRIFINSTGTLTNNGTVTVTYNAGTSPTVNGGSLRSSPNSEFNLGTAGMDIPNTATATSLIEVAGTITNNRPIAIGAGKLCIGTWTGTECTQSRIDTLEYGALTIGHLSNGTAVNGYIANIVDLNSTLTIQSSATLSTTFESITGAVMDAYADINITSSLTTATFNGELQMVGAAGSVGNFTMQNGATATLRYTGANQNSLGSIYMLGSSTSPYPDTTLNIGDATRRPIVNIIDYQTCGIYSCYLQMNNIGNTLYKGKSILNNYGIINVPYTATNPRAVIGDSLTGTGQGRFNVKDDFGGTTVAFNSDMTSGIYVQSSGRVDVEYTSGTQYASFLHEGPVYLTGDGTAYNITPSNDNRGINVGGIFECKDTLKIGDATYAAAMDVFNSGTVTVNGNPNNAFLQVYRILELDGTMNVSTGNYGDTTVYSGGTIRSGGTDAGQTDSNFLLNTYLLDVRTGGQINSNAASTRLLSGTDGAGSNGGEGEGRSGGHTPSTDKIKFNMDTIPYDTAPYGEAGMVSAGVDGKGGGAIRLNIRGPISVSGNITANGGDSTNTSGGAGAGGTIIIKHTPTHASSSSFELTGSGLITANGGNSSTSGVPVGGGGKIYIDSIYLDNPDDGTYTEYTYDIRNIRAYGGANSADSHYASAGTIVFMGDTNNPDGTLIVDQGSGRTATSGEVAFIRDNGNTGFDRVEAKNGADVAWDNVPTTEPVSCYELGAGSSVDFNTTYTCSDHYLPDKPYKLYVNNSITGAQSATEPSGIGPTSVTDITPVFSAVLLNPQNPTENITKINIQVDDSSDFATPLWDGTVDLTTVFNGTAVQDGDRTVDVEYSGSALSVSTTYYFRARFLGAADEPGLWNHRDWQNQYQFDVDSYYEISGCTGTRDIKDSNAAGRPVGSNIRYVNGDKYGYDSCNLTLTSTVGGWAMYYGKAPNQTNFTDGINSLDPIANGTPTCDFSMDTTGGSSSEDEYGFNITTTLTAVKADPEATTCGLGSYYYTDTNHFFDIESSASPDYVIEDNLATPITNETVTIKHHISVDSATVPGTDYELYTRAILTDAP